MTDRSSIIFGNKMSSSTIKKAERSKRKFIRKFGDDSNADYKVWTEKNPSIGVLSCRKAVRCFSTITPSLARFPCAS